MDRINSCWELSEEDPFAVSVLYPKNIASFLWLDSTTSHLRRGFSAQQWQSTAFSATDVGKLLLFCHLFREKKIATLCRQYFSISPSHI